MAKRNFLSVLSGRRIATIPLCTSCRKDLFYSYRRDGCPSGRMLKFVRAIP